MMEITKEDKNNAIKMIVNSELSKDIPQVALYIIRCICGVEETDKR